MYLDDYDWAITIGNGEPQRFTSLNQIAPTIIVGDSYFNIRKHGETVIGGYSGRIVVWGENNKLINRLTYTGRNYYLPVRNLVPKWLKEAEQIPEWME